MHDDFIEDMVVCHQQISTSNGVKRTQPALKVIQLSSASITVSWSDLDCSDQLDGNNSATKHTYYSLYVTPISGLQHTASQDENRRLVLVLPFVTMNGTHRIDLLDSGSK